MSTDFSDQIIPTDFIEALDSQDFTDFLIQISNSDQPLLSVTLPIAPIDPLAALELNPEFEEKFYWDHPENDISISAAGKVRELKSTGGNRFEQISEQTSVMKDQIDAYTSIKHSMAGPLLLGGYSFDNYNIGKVWKKFGAANFILPEWMVVKNGNLHLLTLIFDKKDCTPDEIYQQIISQITGFLNISSALPGFTEGNRSSGSIYPIQDENGEKQLWIQKVEAAKQLIKEGEFEKIVLARSKTFSSIDSPESTVLIHQLRQKYSECFNFMIQKDSETTFIGSTPERLASFRNNIFSTDGLAGSTSRGRSAIEDASLATNLMNSKKDRDEHDFVVRAINENLKNFSYRIEHPKQPGIKKLKNVQHLFTPISASIKENVQIHELINEMHPTPAVGGFPRDKAVAHIHDIEEIDRGWYAAPVGWFNMSGSGEFAVAIRSALLHDESATLYAGCGIVADSDPEKEWNETLLKFKPMLDSLNGGRFDNE